MNHSFLFNSVISFYNLAMVHHWEG